MRHIVPILASIYWTLAMEVDGAVNGFTLTRGLFLQQIHIEYATGTSVYTQEKGQENRKRCLHLLLLFKNRTRNDL